MEACQDFLSNKCLRFLHCNFFFLFFLVRLLYEAATRLTQSSLNFPPGFNKGLIVEYHAVRHGRLQGIPELNIAFCKWRKKQNIIGVKTEEWKNKAAEDLTHT